MEALLGVVLARPTRRMAEEGQDEQYGEGRGEGMGIERERESPLPHRPGGLRLMLMRAWVLVDLVAARLP